MKVRDGLAVGVVVDGDTELLEAFGGRGVEPGGGAERACHVAQAVAEEADDRPAAKPPLERAVDEEAGADLGAQVEVRLEARVLGDLAGEVVVEVADLHARLEEGEQRGPVHVERDVEHRAAIASGALHPPEQGDVALDAGDERAGRRAVETQLLERAQTVGVAVEDVAVIHSRTPFACRKATIASAASSGEAAVVSILISGLSGPSYGESMPVKFLRSPRRAFL